MLPSACGLHQEGRICEASQYFIDGLQPDKFLQAVQAHDTNIIQNTCELIGDDITESEGVLWVLGILK